MAGLYEKEDVFLGFTCFVMRHTETGKVKEQAVVGSVIVR
jgi:hypothetical protein